jgi:Spy/CpxP family protein refolding chaperone
MRHRILGLFLCLLILATPMLAQGPRRRAARRQAVGMMRVLRQLNLTPDQQAQVRTLFQQQRQQVQALNQEPLTVAQRQTKVRAIRQNTQQQLQALLTPEQRQRLVDIRGRRNPLQALNLTPEQQAKIRPLIQQQRQQAQDIRRDLDLTPRQKQEKIRALREATHAQVNSLLTPEQQQQLEQLRPRGRGPVPAPGAAPNPSGK